MKFLLLLLGLGAALTLEAVTLVGTAPVASISVPAHPARPAPQTVAAPEVVAPSAREVTVAPTAGKVAVALTVAEQAPANAVPPSQCGPAVFQPQGKRNLKVPDKIAKIAVCMAGLPDGGGQNRPDTGAGAED